MEHARTSPSPLVDELVEAWRINNRVNVRLIEHITDEGMRSSHSHRGGRNVVRQFAHLHTVRVFQLSRRAKALAHGLPLFGTHDEPARTTLTEALEASSERVAQWIRLAADGAPGVRTLRRGLVPTVGYLISHESHHRGNILLTLKHCGHAVDVTTRLGIWDWDHV